MKCSACVMAGATIILSTLPATAQVGNIKDIPARVELHTVKSLWLSDQEFLKGDPNGKEATIGIELRIAQGPGKRPTIILMHGSSGVGPNVPFWCATSTPWVSTP